MMNSDAIGGDLVIGFLSPAEARVRKESARFGGVGQENQFGWCWGGGSCTLGRCTSSTKMDSKSVGGKKGTEWGGVKGAGPFWPFTLHPIVLVDMGEAMVFRLGGKRDAILGRIKRGDSNPHGNKPSPCLIEKL